MGSGWCFWVSGICLGGIHVRLIEHSWIRDIIYSYCFFSQCPYKGKKTRFSAHNVDLVLWYGTVLEYHGNNRWLSIGKSRLETSAQQLLTEIVSKNWKNCYSAPKFESVPPFGDLVDRVM